MRHIPQCQTSWRRWAFQCRSLSAQQNLEPRPDLVIVGNAISRGNPELEAVLDQRIPFESMARVLHDEFLVGKERLVVAGTHGKTTTSSLLAWIFHHAGT